MSIDITTPTFTPEKLNLWDRFFNRYRREVVTRATENWKHQAQVAGIPTGDPFRYTRDYVEYRIIDRLTGSVRIEREYLN